MLKKLFKTYGRRRTDELMAALMALPIADLISGIVRLFAAGELRFATKRNIQSAQNMCADFYRYHRANEKVADWFLAAARSLQKEQHRKHYSIGALTERIRHDIRMGVIKTDGFRISNDVRACYARLVVMRDPTLCGLFTIKRSKVDAFLIIDGRSWGEFAKEHHAELWPRPDALGRKQPETAPDETAQLPLATGAK